MLDRPMSQWSQTMNRIHSPTPDTESVHSSHMETSLSRRTTTRLMPLQDENPNATPRKRNNSLIPIELMINSGEGGRECAALATVFGVPEYVDSKIFWERQQYQHEGLLPKKQVNPLLLRPNNTSTLTATNENKYGYVSVNGTSVMSRPLSSTSGNEDDTIMLPDQSKFVISSYVDSVLDPVGSSELLKPSFPGSNTAPSPTASKSFSLPAIPTVSKFNDILYEDENGFDIMFPANPSSILIHSSTPIIKTESISSVDSSLVLSSHSAKNITVTAVQDEETESINPTSKLVVVIGSPELFDLIISDQDERFIIWGPDPIVLSSSMATTTTPESPSSYATLYNNQQNKRPELKGFSSNATSTLTRSKSIQNTNNTRSSFASVRLSAQLWSESLKLGNKHQSTLNNDRPQMTKHGSLLLRKAFGIKSKHANKRNSVSSDVNTLVASNIPKVIEAATIHKLVEKLTNTLDYTFMTDFFLTYRDFLCSEDLCQLLISRFYWALKDDQESRRIVRIRTFVVLRHWLNNYFVHDFIGNRPLRRILTDFLNKLPRHPLVKESPRDQRIVKILKRVVRRLKKLYYNRSSGASRVKVIAPPPPTAEQEQMGEIVRAKLSQNAIRRKTALGVDMSSHHNGNMAVQDARYAPVVVVGSLNMKGSFIDSGLENNKTSFVQLRRYPSQHSAPAPHEVENSVVTGLEDTQTIRSSVHHRYDKSVHETSDLAAEGGTSNGGANEASSVISVASDDSLESELSAGETIPDESDEEEEDTHSQIQQGSFVEYDEHERHWLQEQQETLNYFKALGNGKTAFDQPESAGLIAEDISVSPTQLTAPALHIRPKIPTEFIHVDKADLTSEYSIPSTPSTPTHATAQMKKENSGPREIRRVPSERWCKTDDYQNKHPLDVEHSKSLPDELLKELSGDEAQHRTPIGLSRKLSKKSIERRKSERSLQDGAWSSLPSSATNSPYLTGAVSDHDIPDVPELPPLTPYMFGGGGGGGTSIKGRSKLLKKKKSLLNKKKSNISHPDESLPVENIAETFASIPYEATKVSKSSDEPKEDGNTENKSVPKRRLSRALSRVFRPNQEEKAAKEDIKVEPMSTTSSDTQVKIESVPAEAEQEKQQGGHLVSLIAQRLRLNSVDDSEPEDACDCAKCSGRDDSPITCRRLSVMLIADDERRNSFELRRKRGASIDMDHHDLINHLGSASKEQKNGKDVKTGPVYLGHLQARSVIGSNILHDDDQHSVHSVHDSDNSDDDNSTVSFVPSERSIRTEAQASSSRARMSFVSDATSPVPRSKMIELGIPPEVPNHLDLEKSLTDHTETPSSVPRPIQVNHGMKPTGRCFIMSYRTSKIASQLCFIERDVLVKVGWEELIHCKWTKMDASGKINPNYGQESNFEGIHVDEEKINYTRQSEMRRTEEQGIEQVILRFNTVCLWVSSEIVRTRNINERVKLIEKFIRLAKKCKMYSNYATLVQILLGLQSPAVARLERTWSKVSAKCQKLLNKLTEFTSPMKNWKNIRDSMTEVAEEYGNSPAEVQVEMPGTTANKQKFKKTTRIKIPFGGCIPFLGIYLSDLVFNSEKPRFLKANLESQRIYSANNTRNMPVCLDQPLVNFRKHRVIATVIKRVLTFQGLSTRYSFDADGILLEKCRNLQVLDPAKIRELSAALE